jgi:hypothetical protein
MGIEKILNNLLASDVYHGKGTQILKLTDEMMKQMILIRRMQHQAV